jgi:hypothetical protein
LRQQGFTVLHFWNHDVLQRTDRTLLSIRECVLALGFPAHLPKLSTLSPALSRQREREYKGCREKTCC